MNNDTKISIIDSLSLAFSSAVIADVNDENILVFNFTSSEIGIYNFESKQTKRFNKFGQGKDEFMTMLRPQTVNFVNDSLIGLSSTNKIMIYNFNGDLKKVIKVKNENTYAPLANYEFIGDSILIALIQPQGNNTLKSFYEQPHKLLLKKDIKNDELKLFADFPLKNSDFNDSDFYYPYPFNYYHRLDSDSFQYNFVNSNDRNIYRFDVSTSELISVSSLKLEHYKPLKIPFGSKLKQGRLEAQLQFYTNSIIMNYFKDENHEYISYSEALDRDYVIEKLKNSLSDNGMSDNLKTKNWLHIMKNGEKLIDDIHIPQHFGIPLHIFSSKKVLFSVKTTEEDDLKGVSKFILCNLNI